MARSEGLEPPTYKFVACCSIQLSYDRTDSARYAGRASSATVRDTRSFFYSLPAKVATRQSFSFDEYTPEREGFEPSIRLYIV
jgi:hypothetical protein